MRASLIALATATLASPALAQSAQDNGAQTQTQQRFDIPAGDLSAALRAFGEQSDTNILFDAALVEGRSTQGLQGAFSPSEALHRLLAGTGLTVARRPDGGFVLADASSPTQLGAAEQGAPSDEIVVTAQKREQSVQDVPMSVSVIGERTIEDAGIDNFTEYARMTPGLSFAATPAGGGQFGDRNVFVRGISSSNTIGGGQPTAFYLGDTPVPFSDPNLFDVNRIEVLRGPQGTLYGSGSMGGTVKIVPNAPNVTDYSGRADATLSTTDGGGVNYETRGVVNLPIVEDRIALRASAAYRHDEGFVDDAHASLLCATPGPACFGSAEIEDNVDDVDTFT
ncbi:MAG TPA: TonB-dependent receptor, partial [Verrucomicrobiae bacterium]|nr:TonB-dependent receptor [Verrucomicrobiae bacterium]